MIGKLYKGFMFACIIVILGLVAWFMGAVVELIIMMLSFLIAKQRYEFKYHCKSSFHCLVLSVVVFVIGLRVTLPASVSYVCSGACGLLIAHGAQYIARLQFIEKDYQYIEPKYNEYVKIAYEKKTYCMEEQSLRKLCREHLLDPIDEEIVVQRLVYKLKGQELYSKIGYSKPQMIRREKRIEEKLNLKLKDR